MKVLFVNNSGGGFADYVQVAERASVAQFFEQRMRGCNAEDHLIRVNR